MIDQKALEDARKILGLRERASITEIKEAYRKASKRYHPDKCKSKDKEKCEKKFKQINAANQVLAEFCLSYKIPLTGKDMPNEPEKAYNAEHIRRFYDGWWDNLSDETV